MTPSPQAAYLTRLLLLLAEHYEFLFRPGYYSIVDSVTGTGMGAAWIDLRWNGITLRFWTERSEQGIDIRVEAEDWVGDLGLVRAYLGRGDLADVPGMDAEAARELEETLPEFEHHWADEAARAVLIEQCRVLKTKRSRIWFG
ncbi:hypothetical protein [Nocardioides korecus]